MSKFSGIELRGVQMDDGSEKSFYVSALNILACFPDAVLETHEEMFDYATKYLEESGIGVVSCDAAKINEIYLSMS